MKKYFPYIYFLVASIALFFIYYPAREGAFVYDFMWTAYYYNHYTWKDILKCTFDQSYHLFYQVEFYLAYIILRTHASRWLLLFSVLNAGAITLVFILIKKLLEQAQISRAFGIALCGTLLVLFNPYMDQTVLWGAAIHYSTASSCIIISWLLLIQYTETTMIKYVWLSYAVFFIAVYSLEISVAFPFITFIYLFLWPKQKRINLRRVLLIVFPQFLLVFSFFAMNKIVFGNWVGHYGAAVHLNLEPAYMSSQLACYLLKYVGLMHFFQFSIRDMFYSFVQNKAIGYILLFCLYIIPFLLIIILYKKNTIILKAGLIIYSFACFALLPTQNLYFMYLFRTENDRLGYFFSLFIYMMVSYILVKLFKWFGYIILLVYGIIGFHFLKIEIDNWRQGGNVVHSLLREYKWGNNQGKVNILIIGDNLNGAFLFRNFSDTSFFPEYYEVMNKKECSPIQHYMTMTMTSENDSVTAHAVNDSTIQVDLLTGNWLMEDELGAVDYKTKDVTIVVNKQKPSYQITFKKKHPGDVYIYESGLHWKQVNGF